MSAGILSRFWQKSSKNDKFRAKLSPCKLFKIWCKKKNRVLEQLEEF